jgi:hypothetical protein
LFLSDRLTDEDSDRLEFQARTYSWSTLPERFRRKVKDSSEFISAALGIGMMVGSVWALGEVAGTSMFAPITTGGVTASGNFTGFGGR